MRLRWAIVLLSVALYAQSDNLTALSGSVINSANGQAVAGALVVLEYYPTLSGGGVATQQASERRVTDTAGRFSFMRAPGSGTHLRALREGFQESTYVEGLEDDDDPVTSGTHNIVIHMTPLGVIHGHVKNGDGEPIPDMQVQAIRVSIERGRQVIGDYADAVTDDRGEYRMFRIPGGIYLLKAGGRGEQYASFTGIGRLADAYETYPALYYPSAPAQNSATPITLGAGETLQADFVLEAHPSFKIRGQVQGGNPAVQLRIALRRDGQTMGSRLQYHLSDGSFELSDVVPGAYVLEASQPGTLLRGEVEITVADRDVTGVSLVMSPPPEVHGTVEVTGVGASGSAPKNINISALLRASDRPVPGNTATSQGDGSFRLRLFPGTYDIDPVVGGYYVASIRSGDTDVMADGLPVGPQGAPDIKIVISPGGGMLEGVVTDLPQSPTAGATVLLVRKYGSAIMPRILMAWQGKFKVENLAPGEYTVYAWTPPREVEYYNADALQAISANAVTVYVHDGETQQVNVTLATPLAPGVRP
jgi:hypothetical protein